MCNNKRKLSVIFLLDSARGQAPQEPRGRGKVIDSMVASVNRSLITYSDLLWQVALQPSSVLDNPNRETLERALQLVIDQRLIMQEAEKLPTLSPSDQEIEAAFDQPRRRRKH